MTSSHLAVTLTDFYGRTPAKLVARPLVRRLSPAIPEHDVVRNIRILGVAWLTTLLFTLSAFVGFWSIFGK